MRRNLRLIVLVLIVLLLAVGALLLWPQMEGSAPVIKLAAKPGHLGASSELRFTVSDEGKGLRLVRMSLQQKGGKLKVPLAKEYQAASFFSGSGLYKQIYRLKIEPKKLGLAEGPATVTIEARDHSWRRGLHGNLGRVSWQVQIDTLPPRLAVLNRLTYVNRGGTGVAIYTVSPDVTEHGVAVDQRVFKGYAPWPSKPAYRLCMFAYGEDVKRRAEVKVWARDAAGNRASASLGARIKWKRFRHDTLRVSDRFLSRIVPRFPQASRAKDQSLLGRYLWVNSELRRLNSQTIATVTQKSASRQLWRQVFNRPLGKLTSGFADRRRYLYQGKVVSRAVHLGQDIASLERAPVKAVAAGTVSYAGELGIYGNCLIIDHGLGLTSLYGHLSSIAVRPGQAVQKGQEMARTGETGLAGGDHLHFSVLVGGVFVNPREWWDPKWVRDNIFLHIERAGLPLPYAGGQAKTAKPAAR